MAWCEGKQEVLLKWYIVLIAVLDVVAACANSGNVEINFYSDNCGGKKKQEALIMLIIALQFDVSTSFNM